MRSADAKRVYGEFFKQRKGKMTPYAFAKKVKIKTPRVYDVINGRRLATFGEVLRIADAFGIAGMAELFDELHRAAIRIEEREAVKVEGAVAEGYADSATAATLSEAATGAKQEPTVDERRPTPHR